MSFDLILPFLQPIADYLSDPAISEIMVNPDASIWIEVEGKKRRTEERFQKGELGAGLEVIANKFGKRLSADSPILNLRLPDGSRLAAMIPPLVHPNPLLTIRKFTSRNFTIADLIGRGMLTAAEADALQMAVEHGDNILIAGGTGTGKTTLLNVLSDAIAEEERVLLIEDTAELHIRKPHVVSAESQTDTHRTAVTFDDLLKAVLRHRPDRIIVGEVRGPEARTLLDAMNTGHRGTLATIHANSAQEAIYRLANLAMRSGLNLDLQAMKAEVERCLDLVVQVSRAEGVRRVSELHTISH